MKAGQRLVADVVVCGAGLAGTTTAAHLLRMGVGSVVVVDPLPPLSLTSSMSTECFRHTFPNPTMRAVMLRSIALLEQLSQTTHIGMDPRGYMYCSRHFDRAKLVASLGVDDSDLVFHSPNNAHSAHSAHNAQSNTNNSSSNRDGGLVDVYAGREAVAAHFPFLDAHIESVAVARRCGWVSAQQLGMAMVDEVHQRAAVGHGKGEGTRFVRGRVVGAKGSASAASGAFVGHHGASVLSRVNEVVVRDAAGQDLSVHCGFVVNATGPLLQQTHSALLTAQTTNNDGSSNGHNGSNNGHTSGQEGFSPLRLPVHNEVHAKVVFEDVAGAVPRDAPMVIYTDPQTIAWDADEVEMVGEMVEDEAMRQRALGQLPGGVHLRPYAATSLLLLWECWHAHVQATDPPTFPPPLDHALYPELCLRGLSRVVSSLAQYTAADTKLPRRLAVDGGYYTRTPENLPLVGPVGVCDNYVVVGGLSGFGVMASQALGELAAAWVCGEGKGVEGVLAPQASCLLPTRYASAEYAASLDDLVRLGKLGQI